MKRAHKYFQEKQRKASQSKVLLKPFWIFFTISLKKKKKGEKKSQDRYKNLSDKEKRKKRQYNRDWNKNLSEEEKQTKVE